MKQKNRRSETTGSRSKLNERIDRWKNDAEEWQLLRILFLQKLRRGEREERRRRLMRIVPAAAFFLVCGITVLLMIRAGQAAGPVVPTETEEIKARVLWRDGGTWRVAQTDAQTVGEFLSCYHISLSEKDELTPPKETPICEGMRIVIDRVSVLTEKLSAQIPYQTVTNEVQTIPRGEIRVERNGENGRKVISVRRTYRNGHVERETVLEEKTVTEPIDCIRNVGVGGWINTADGVLHAFSYYIDVSATAYGYPDDDVHITYSGIPCHDGTIAVDPSIIPLGTKVYVTGPYGDYGICTAEDIGGGIKGAKIDIYMSYEEAVAFGLRSMRVYFIDS